MDWSVVYEQAEKADGTLYFPERLSKEFLEQARRTMGSYLYANQYQNIIIPDSEKRFKKQWLRYTTECPSLVTRWGFIDPAIGQSKHNDYTGIVIVNCAEDRTWFIRHASRQRLTPTEIVSKAFDLCQEFKLDGLGIESVAYQEALLYFMSEEMQKRDKFLPVKGITRSRVTKESRILGLVPRFEFGKIFLYPGMVDLEDEIDTFPRGNHDDILDALASIEEIAYYPVKEQDKLEQPHSQNDPNYEKWYIQQLAHRANNKDRDGGGSFGEFGD